MLSCIGFASPFSENCTITALAAASTDLDGPNVASDDLTLVWRAVPTLAIIRFDFASTRYREMDGVYIAGHNLNGYVEVDTRGGISPTDSWEVLASDDPAFDVFQRPASIQEATNLTAVSGFTEYDPNSVTIAYSATTGGVLSRLRVRFTNPGPASVTTLPAYPPTTPQQFLAGYTTTGTGTLSLTARLKESGTLRTTLLSGFALSVGTGLLNVLALDWNGAALIGATPDLELEVAATGTAKVHWHPIRWDAYLTPSAPTFYYSNQITPPLSPGYRATDRTILSDSHLFPAPQVVRRLFVKMTRTGQNSSPGVAAEVGRIDGGLRLQFRMAKDTWSITPVDPSEVLEMRGGNERIHEARPYLMADVRTPIEPISTALAEKMAMERFAGIRRGLYWMFDDSRRDWAPYTWFFGRLTDLAPFGNIYKFFTHAFRVRQIR